MNQDNSIIPMPDNPGQEAAHHAGRIAKELIEGRVHPAIASIALIGAWAHVIQNTVDGPKPSDAFMAELGRHMNVILEIEHGYAQLRAAQAPAEEVAHV